MRKSSVLLLSAALAVGAALPASAMVRQIGSVNVSADHYSKVSWSRFDGPVERLSLMPDNDTIQCDHITVNYRDGTSHDVFSGVLMQGQRQTILFPRDSNDGRIDDISFACKAENVDGARIALSSVSDGGYGVRTRPDVRVYETPMPADDE